MNDVPLWVRSQDNIAQGVLTNSKHPDRFIGGIYPTHAKSSAGCYIFSERGQRYTDYICGLGTNLLGYANPKIREAVTHALGTGASPSLPTIYEVEVAELLKEFFCFVEKWKFLKSGSEACSAAIKIARAHTKRLKIASQGYHGWHDEFVSLTPPATGAHKCADITLYKDDMDLGDVAAVIVEPIITDLSDERIKWLYELRDKCTKAGALLIFDEVITGFRFPKYSVSAHLNIVPDLIVIGKAMANGMPLAAVGGTSKVMNGDYFVSSTYAGEVYSLAACKKVLEIFRREPFYSVDKLWEAGGNFKKRFNEMGALVGLAIDGYNSRGVLKGGDIIKALFMQEACKAGFLFGPSWFYNALLSQEDYSFFTFFKDFIQNINLGHVALEGSMPTSPFSAKARS